MLAIKKILFPTDFSENSEAAFRLACALARDYGATLSLLHVMVPPVVIYSEGVFPPEPIVDEAAHRAQLEKLRPHDPAVAVERRMVEGDAATEILKAAKEIKADVILMGTHGRTGLSRLLMGSVAEEVVRKAMCPVLTIKTPAPRSSKKPAPEAAEMALAGAKE